MFTNRYTLNEEMLKEYIHKFLYKKMCIYGYSLSLISALLYILIGYSYFLWVTLILLPALIITPKLAIKQLIEGSKKLNNGTIVETVIKFGNSIILDEGKSHLEIEYNQVQKVIETKKLIILKLTEQTAVVVAKAGFEENNKDEFIKFINEKIK